MRDTSDRCPIRFGIFEFDRRSGELWRRGVRVKLCHHASRLLSLLVKTPGKIRTREELRHQLWPRTTFVNFDQSINKAVHELREALGDWATNPRFIETIVGQGYRFIPDVRQPRLPSRTVVEPRTRSLAVLPFAAVNAEAGNAFVSSQIAARLIDALSKIRGIRVLAYSTVKHVTSEHGTPQDIGKRLGVSEMLVGELLWQGDDLVVHAELIDVGDGTQIWGAQIQQHCESLVECATELATAILQQVTPNLERGTVTVRPVRGSRRTIAGWWG